MHFIAYFIGISSTLTLVNGNIEHHGKSNIISFENDNQDDGGVLNGLKLIHDESKIHDGLLGSLELRKKKCGKTKQACKDAGGYCHARSEEDDCDGNLLKGKKYCSRNNKCGCCVPKATFIGPFNNIWNDTQCPVIESYKKKSFSECTSLCVNTEGCTAINFSDSPPGTGQGKDGCVLRGCSEPVPLPDWEYPPYQGYALSTAMFTGPTNKIWSDCQCPVIESYKKKSFSECTSLCVNTEGCTAINFSDSPPGTGQGKDGCVLRGCSEPVPLPDWSYPPYQGYALSTAMFTGPTNKIWSDSQCPVIESYEKKSFSECTALCVNTEGCTAINFSNSPPGTGKGKDGCVLRGCSEPVPLPDWEYPPYHGYYLRTELCTRVNGGLCSLQLTSYIRKYASNGNPCVCKINNGNLVPAECAFYNDGFEYCYIENVVNPVICGDICQFANMPHFNNDHVCDNCNTPLLTQDFCKKRVGDKKNVNTVFTTQLTWGKIDYAVNQYGQLQQICRLPYYVIAWYCVRDKVLGWQCSYIQLCTGGGTMPTGNPGDKPGHFMLTSLHCQH